MKYKTLQKDLKCTVCGNVQQIQRKANKNRKTGHVKTFWCPYCLKEQDHVELHPFHEAL